MISRDHLRQILEYSPASGEFCWRVRRPKKGGWTNVGEKAGFIRGDDGYVFIGIDGVAYPAQKLAWLYMTGEFPTNIIDHRNRDRADNRWENLRPATRSQNNMNKSVRSDNVSGVTGVSFDRARDKWVARIRVDEKYLMLGRFSTKEEAVQARINAECKHYGEFAPTLAA